MTEQEVRLKKDSIQDAVERICEDLCWIRDTFNQVIFVVDNEVLDISEERRRADEHFKKLKEQQDLKDFS